MTDPHATPSDVASGTSSDATTPEDEPGKRPERKGIPGRVDAIDRAMKESFAGDLANLRRILPENPCHPAFWKLALPLLDSPEFPLTREREVLWAVIISGMAQTAGLHVPGLNIGEALLRADVSEARISRLLQAKDKQLWRHIRYVSHQLASAGARFDYASFAYLVLTDGGENADLSRRIFARDYYGAKLRAESDAKKATAASKKTNKKTATATSTNDK